MRVGTYAGAPVVFTSSWLLLSVILVVMFGPVIERNWPQTGNWAYALAGVGIALLGASTLAHEMAHAVVAHRSGMRIRLINVTFWGGSTQLSVPKPRPLSHALVSLAGPTANIILALIGYIGAVWTTSSFGFGTLTGALFSSFAWVNGIVAAVNLIPGMPLDGGGILEAIAWSVTGDRSKGAKFTGRFSQALGIVLALSPLLLSVITSVRPSLMIMVWCFILGAVMWGAGSTAYSESQRKALPISEASYPAVGIQQESQVGDLPNELLALTNTDESGFNSNRVVVFTQHIDGKISGWIDPDSVHRLPESARASTSVAAVMRPLPAHAWITVHDLRDEKLVEVLHQVQQTTAGIAILNAQPDDSNPPEVVGAISLPRLMTLLQSRSR